MFAETLFKGKAPFFSTLTKFTQKIIHYQCHKKADSEREEENRYYSGLDTYMTKKYGEDCDYFDGCEEEFDAWLDRKRNYD